MSKRASAPAVVSRRGRVVRPKVWDDGTVAAVAGGSAQSEGSLKSSPEAASSAAAVPEGGVGASNTGSFASPVAGEALSSAAGGGGIFKQAAVEVLRVERRLMTTGEIARVALQRGLVRATGKTPEATMASALYTDIKRREGTSVFIRPHEGLFGLREWLELGIQFRDDYAEELARRTAATYGPYAAQIGLRPGLLPHPLAYGSGMQMLNDDAGTAVGSTPGSSGGLMELLDAAEMELKRSPSSMSSPTEQKDASSLSPTGSIAEHPNDKREEHSEPVPSSSAPSSEKGAVPLHDKETNDTPHIDELRIAIRRAEANVRALELELGPLHPAVGRALIDTARFHMQAEQHGVCCDAVPTPRQQADAALIRASQVMAAWQDALGRPKFETSNAFASLLSHDEGKAKLPFGDGDGSNGAAPPTKCDSDDRPPPGTLTETGNS